MAVIPGAYFLVGCSNNMLATADAKGKTTDQTMARRLSDLAGPCFRGDIDATEGIQNCLAATDDGRIIDGRKVDRSSLKWCVHCAYGHNSARSLDATCRPCVP